MENGGSCEAGAPVSDDILLAPYYYIRRMPGKQIRSELSRAFNYWLEIEEVKLNTIMELVEMLHNASLMVDDIEDSSVLRRGLPVTHNVYGIPATINAANYVYFMALSKCLQLGHPRAIEIFTEQMLELHRGQGKELHWRDTHTCPSESEYDLMVKQKTGGLFSLAVQLMQLFSTCTSDFVDLINNLAVYFQIRDDYINLTSTEYAKQKSFAEDLTEGKFSYPIISALTPGRDKNDEIITILRRRTTDNDVKKYCISLIEERGGFRSTEEKLVTVMADIERNIRALPKNPLLEFLVKKINIMADQGKNAQCNNGEDHVVQQKQPEH
uniref:Geranylgeranyl pyrophosphate synthase n=1 Tax=Steinernema glaseri TaxID=37863 RepID=A0A1I7ZR54_9BILA